MREWLSLRAVLGVVRRCTLALAERVCICMRLFPCFSLIVLVGCGSRACGVRVLCCFVLWFVVLLFLHYCLSRLWFAGVCVCVCCSLVSPLLS